MAENQIMTLWGILLFRLKGNYVNSWGTFPVDTIVNESALKHFGCKMPAPANDNMLKEIVA